MYTNGHGVARDDAAAATWYRKAADQGAAPAQNNLGVGYANGPGVPQDDAAAVTWYRKAADQGYARAQHNLGAMYENGRGVSQDYLQAHKWYNLAAARYPASETGEREKAERNRGLVAVKMTAAQFVEAQRLAREWKPK
jgi:TPR repeat protein